MPVTACALPAQRLGEQAYRWISTDAPSTMLAGDWVFAGCLGAVRRSAGDYLDAMQRRYPPGSLPDFGLEALATARGEAARFLEECLESTDWSRFDLVGFTSTFSQHVAALCLSGRIKEGHPNIQIVFGGANCEGEMGHRLLRSFPFVDFVATGEADISFPQLVRALDSGESDPQIPGIVGRGNSASADLMPELASDLDTLPYPDFDDFFREHAALELAERPSLPMETSRGCWWGERAHCTFCGLNSDSMGYRSMSSERAITLIQSLFKYASRTSRLECVDNIMPKSYLREVFPNLETPSNLTIFYEVKADLSDADLALLAKARVHSLQPGIEALATSTLKLMKKGTSGSGNVRFLKDCVRHGIYPEWNLLVGFPGEDERVYEAYERDLPSLMHLPPPSGVYPIRFDRFSPYHTRAAEYGLDLHPYDFYALVYPFPERSLQNLAYYFIDRNFAASYITTTAKWIGRLRAQIDRIVAYEASVA